MQTRDAVENSLNTPCVYMRLCEPVKVLYYFLKIFHKNTRKNIKRRNRVYKLSSKHTYRPISARYVSYFLKLIYILCECSETFSFCEPETVLTDRCFIGFVVLLF